MRSTPTTLHVVRSGDVGKCSLDSAAHGHHVGLNNGNHWRGMLERATVCELGNARLALHAVHAELN